jgi:hypothetical protein
LPGVIESEENGRDLVGIVVHRVGRLLATGELGEPYRLVDASDAVVVPAAAFFRELLAAGRSAATLRSYGMDLLRWWRFLHAVDVGWDRATRMEARDFSCWIQVTMKQRRLAARSDTGPRERQTPSLARPRRRTATRRRPSRTAKQFCVAFTTFIGMRAPAQS